MLLFRDLFLLSGKPAEGYRGLEEENSGISKVSSFDYLQCIRIQLFLSSRFIQRHFSPNVSDHKPEVEEPP